MKTIFWLLLISLFTACGNRVSTIDDNFTGGIELSKQQTLVKASKTDFRAGENIGLP